MRWVKQFALLAALGLAACANNGGTGLQPDGRYIVNEKSAALGNLVEYVGNAREGGTTAIPSLPCNGTENNGLGDIRGCSQRMDHADRAAIIKARDEDRLWAKAPSGELHRIPRTAIATPP